MCRFPQSELTTAVLRRNEVGLSTFRVMTETECWGKSTRKFGPILIVFCCSETAFGVAKLLAEVIESALIVSMMALEDSCAPTMCTEERSALCGSVLTARSEEHTSEVQS